MKDVEECMVLKGKRYGSYWIAKGYLYVEGEFSTVSFDHNEVRKLTDGKNEDGTVKPFKNLLGFWHTHPQWISSPSWLDFTTMNDWTTTSGKDLLCLITGIDGNYNHKYRFSRLTNVASDPKEKFIKIGNWFFGKATN